MFQQLTQLGDCWIFLNGKERNCIGICRFNRWELSQKGVQFGECIVRMLFTEVLQIVVQRAVDCDHFVCHRFHLYNCIVQRIALRVIVGIDLLMK